MATVSTVSAGRPSSVLVGSSHVFRSSKETVKLKRSLYSLVKVNE